MRLCGKCWKNMKDEPGAILQTKSTTMLICENCIKSNIIQSMLKENKATLIYSTPTLEEIKEEKN